ncbi:MAG TPA: DUF5063 domain-containing protein [Bacteroidetes bacterium]|nr:DUF5063 domain-containing protein [Bacteroidota bacterium]
MVHPETHPVFSGGVIAFVRSAGDFCSLLENTGSSSSRGEWVRSVRLSLLRLYHDFSLIPPFEAVLDEPLEKFVTEVEWNSIRDSVMHLLGRFNEYLEVFDERMRESETPVVCSIAEDMADIYQDIKDFVSLYHIGTPDIMNDALAECQEHFIDYWGQKAVNVLRALHNLEFGSENLDEYAGGQDAPGNNLPDTDNWIISRRMREYGKEQNDELF